MKKMLAVLLCAALLVLPLCLFAQANEPAPLKFLVLGDSISAGSGALLPGGDYASLVAKEKGYDLNNLARGGETSTTMLRKATEDEALRQAIGGADIIAISIGGNDFLHSALPIALDGLLGDFSPMEPIHAALRLNFAAIIEEIRELNPEATLVVQTLYNPVFALLPPTFHTAFDKVMQGNNEIFRAYLAENPEAYLIADVYAAFESQYFLVTVDMTHPSDCGHRVIARVVADTIDGMQTELEPASAALDFAVDMLQPVLRVFDWLLVTLLGALRSALPGLWANWTQL